MPESAIGSRSGILSYYAELFERVQTMYQERVAEAKLGATLFTATHFWHFAGLHDETISRAQCLLSATSDDEAHLRSQLKLMVCLPLYYEADKSVDTSPSAL